MLRHRRLRLSPAPLPLLPKMAGREYVAKTLVGPEHTPLLEVRKLAVAEGVDDMQLRIAMESIDVRAPAGACSAFFPSRLSTMLFAPCSAGTPSST